MVAVLVALLMQIQDDGLLAPTSLFLFMVAMSFVIAAILHPLEFGCLPYGIVYYITIPSMYLLLIIYSLMNLHVKQISFSFISLYLYVSHRISFV